MNPFKRGDLAVFCGDAAWFTNSIIGHFFRGAGYTVVKSTGEYITLVDDEDEVHNIIHTEFVKLRVEDL